MQYLASSCKTGIFFLKIMRNDLNFKSFLPFTSEKLTAINPLLSYAYCNSNDLSGFLNFITDNGRKEIDYVDAFLYFFLFKNIFLIKIGQDISPENKKFIRTLREIFYPYFSERIDFIRKFFDFNNDLPYNSIILNFYKNFEELELHLRNFLLENNSKIKNKLNDSSFSHYYKHSINEKKISGLTKYCDIASSSLIDLYYYKFIYLKDEPINTYPEFKVYLDSGVFTFRQKNKSISNQELIDFYNKNKDIINYIFTNDEGSAEQQYQNYIELRNANLPVIPIYHPSLMKFSYFERFVKDNPINYIAVGDTILRRIVSSKRIILLQKLFDKIFNYLYKNNLWPMKIHLLGVDVSVLFFNYPIYSTDSSSITRLTHGYGISNFFDPITMTIRSFHWKDDKKEILDMINNFYSDMDIDLNLLNLLSFDLRNVIYRYMLNILFRRLYVHHIKNYWQLKGINWINWG